VSAQRSTAPETALVSTNDGSRPRTLHRDDEDTDCPKVKQTEMRPVDPDQYPHTEWCDYCSGEWSAGETNLDLSRALRDDAVTSIDDLADALGGER